MYQRHWEQTLVLFSTSIPRSSLAAVRINSSFCRIIPRFVETEPNKLRNTPHIHPPCPADILLRTRKVKTATICSRIHSGGELVFLLFETNFYAYKPKSIICFTLFQMEISKKIKDVFSVIKKCIIY